FPLIRTILDRPPGPVGRLEGGRIFERVHVIPHAPRGYPSGPERTTAAYFRRAGPELWALAGGLGGNGYGFNKDPDGTYSYYDRIMREATDSVPWLERLAELRLT